MRNSSSDRRPDDKIFIAYLALLVWLPIPFGSADVWGWAIMEMGAFGILSVWLYNYSRKPFELPPSVKAARIPLMLLCVWLFYLLLQAVPMPSVILKLLDPETFKLYDFAAGGDVKYASLSIDRGATLNEFLKSAAYIAIFFLTLVLVNSRSRLRRLATVLMFVGFAESLYGLLNTLSGVEYILWEPKLYYRGVVTGTFINKNHFAGHLELLIPLSLAIFLMEQQKSAHDANWKAKTRDIGLYLLGRPGRRFILILIMFAALFLSGSRGGVASLLVAMAVVFLMAFLNKGKRAKEVRYAPILLLIIILAISWLGVGDLPERYVKYQGSAEQRMEVWSQTKDAISDHPAFGAGAGTFRYIYMLYEESGEYFYHTHNDYLQVLVEQGAIGFSLLALSLFLIMSKILGAYIKRKDLFLRSILFASLAGSLSLLLHAFVDFNFQIPANTAYFYVVLGMGIAAGAMKRKWK